LPKGEVVEVFDRSHIWLPVNIRYLVATGSTLIINDN
jgi:hypothetical protein